jgi:hypothetical protein
VPLVLVPDADDAVLARRRDSITPMKTRMIATVWVESLRLAVDVVVLKVADAL